MTLEQSEKYIMTKEELKAFEIPNNEPFRLEIHHKDVKYEFFIRIKKEDKNLLILGSGAFKPSAMSLPVFHRHSWIEDMDISMIFYNDPTLYRDRLMLGWGVGDDNTHYLNEISNILSIIQEKLSIQNSNMYFYGSSAGGFMSLMLAASFKNATAIVNNPQTIVTNYEQSVHRILNLFNLSEEEMYEKYSDRISVVEKFKKEDHVPRIYYLQNAYVEHDVARHLTPFLNQLREVNEEAVISKVHVELYFNKKLGHNPIGKQATIAYILGVMNPKI